LKVRESNKVKEVQFLQRPGVQNVSLCCIIAELWLGTYRSGCQWTHERIQQATSGWCMYVVQERLQMSLILYPKFGFSCTRATGHMM